MINYVHVDDGSSLCWSDLTDAEISDLFGQMVVHCSSTECIEADWTSVAGSRNAAPVVGW